MSEFEVQDMTCSHCVKTITQALKDYAPDAVIDINLERHSVSVSNVQDTDAIEAAIRNAGYSPVRISSH